MQISIDSKHILSVSVSGSENEPLVWTYRKRAQSLAVFIGLTVQGFLAQML